MLESNKKKLNFSFFSSLFSVHFGLHQQRCSFRNNGNSLLRYFDTARGALLMEFPPALSRTAVDPKTFTRSCRSSSVAFKPKQPRLCCCLLAHTIIRNRAEVKEKSSRSSWKLEKIKVKIHREREKIACASSQYDSTRTRHKASKKAKWLNNKTESESRKKRENTKDSSSGRLHPTASQGDSNDNRNNEDRKLDC